ncbi:MAG TPA: efflux transporter outer membrane subunit [Sphingomicrobium sp.]|nr:efflux transporter outer membrane subunit [Sphingomicrobium sp.]
MPNRTAALAALLLAGCSMQPKYVQPGLPTAPQYPAYAGAAGAGPRAADVEWRGFFRDPRLQLLIATALQNNRDLRTAVLRIAEARGQYRIRRADQVPNVDATASANRSRTPAENGFPPIVSNRFEVGASVASFELDFWGRVRSLTESARASYLSTIHAQRSFQIGLIADVADAYLIERELDDRIALANDTVKSRVRALDIGKQRFEAGVTSALDYRAIETLLTQAQTELADLELQRAETRSELEFLVGGPVVGQLPAPLPLVSQGIVENISPGLPSELLTNRPDILQAEEQLRASNADIGAARAAFFPQISLTGALGYASTALSALFTGNAFNWSFGGNAVLPIFDGGRNKGNLDVAVARHGIAIAGYERAIQNAFHEVSDGLARRKWLADRLASQEREVAAERARAELARLRYINGVANYLEVLDALRELFAIEQLAMATRREQLTNAVDLYVALGGGVEGGRP